jgi:hypothetical protein
MERLLQWDSLELKVSGARIAAIGIERIAAQRAPLRDLAMQFRPGELVVTGKAIKVLPIPFRFVIRRVAVEDLSTLRIVLEDFSAFGFIPLPKLLLQLFPDRQVADGVIVHPEVMAVTVLLDHFLPPFVDLKIESIDFVEGGVRVRVGAGGADPPVEVEDGNGRSH